MLSVHRESTSCATSRYLRTTTYQLIKIPPTNLHIPSVLIQALGETFGVRFATPGTPAIVALVPVLIRLGRHTAIRLLRPCSLRAGAATKESPNRMSDGRADGNTAVGGQISACFWRLPEHSRWETYAAVEAIWPNRPEPCCCCCPAPAGPPGFWAFPGG